MKERTATITLTLVECRMIMAALYHWKFELTRYRERFPNDFRDDRLATIEYLIAHTDNAWRKTTH